MQPLNIGELWMWVAFILFVIAMLAVDLFVFGGRKAHRVSVREASCWVIAWCALALVFAGLLWWYLNGEFGPEIAQRKTLEFLTGYLIEQSLSIDNMFVFVMIFRLLRCTTGVAAPDVAVRCARGNRVAWGDDFSPACGWCRSSRGCCMCSVCS